MDNAITDLLDAVIPELGEMVSSLQFWLGFVMVLGPVLLIAFGAYFYYLAPPEANHKMGYRTHFGMGSIEAWKFTQGFAGKIWGFMGIGLLVVAIVGCILVGVLPMEQGVIWALVILALEAIAAVAGFAVIEFTVSARYDRDGNRKA